MAEKELLRAYFAEILGQHDLKWRNDAVVVPLSYDVALVYSMDRPAFVRGSHGIDAYRYHGRWCAAVVANDVIATGVRPRGISFDVGMHGRSGEEFFAFGLGVQDVCRRYRMRYEGGNMASGDGITGVAWGIASPPSRAIYRRGARSGGRIVVTANIGTGWALRAWSYLRDDMPPDDFNHYKDEPCVDLEAFARVWDLRCIQAGMDLTDGLVEFGYEILEQSGIGVELFAPENLSPAVRRVAEALSLPAEAFAFEPGYDTPFAHAWCIDERDLEAVVKVLSASGVPCAIVGRVDDAFRDVLAVRSDGRRVPLPRYWDDALSDRGSVAYWLETIVPLFT